MLKDCHNYDPHFQSASGRNLQYVDEKNININNKHLANPYTFHSQSIASSRSPVEVNSPTQISSKTNSSFERKNSSSHFNLQSLSESRKVNSQEQTLQIQCFDTSLKESNKVQPTEQVFISKLEGEKIQKGKTSSSLFQQDKKYSEKNQNFAQQEEVVNQQKSLIKNQNQLCNSEQINKPNIQRFESLQVPLANDQLPLSASTIRINHLSLIPEPLPSFQNIAPRNQALRVQSLEIKDQPQENLSSKKISNLTKQIAGEKSSPINPTFLQQATQIKPEVFTRQGLTELDFDRLRSASSSQQLIIPNQICHSALKQSLQLWDSQFNYKQQEDQQMVKYPNQDYSRKKENQINHSLKKDNQQSTLTFQENPILSKNYQIQKFMAREGSHVKNISNPLEFESTINTSNNQQVAQNIYSGGQISPKYQKNYIFQNSFPSNSQLLLNNNQVDNIQIASTTNPYFYPLANQLNDISQKSQSIPNIKQNLWTRGQLLPNQSSNKQQGTTKICSSLQNFQPILNSVNSIKKSSPKQLQQQQQQQQQQLQQQQRQQPRSESLQDKQICYFEKNNNKECKQNFINKKAGQKESLKIKRYSLADPIKLLDSNEDKFTKQNEAQLQFNDKILKEQQYNTDLQKQVSPRINISISTQSGVKNQELSNKNLKTEANQQSQTISNNLTAHNNQLKDKSCILKGESLKKGQTTSTNNYLKLNVIENSYFSSPLTCSQGIQQSNESPHMRQAISISDKLTEKMRQQNMTEIPQINLISSQEHKNNMQNQQQVLNMYDIPLKESLILSSQISSYGQINNFEQQKNSNLSQSNHNKISDLTSKRIKSPQSSSQTGMIKFNNQIEGLNQSLPRQYSISDFDKLKILGQGVFGRVHLVREKRSKGVYALKVIEKQLIQQKNMHPQLLREIDIQINFCQHDNILQCLSNFEDFNNFYLLMEYALDGTCANLLERSPHHRLTESTSAEILRQLLSALAYLHSNSIIHRDIKLENILLTNDQVKLCDFGCSTFCEKQQPLQRRSFCGTIDYISPEMISSQIYDREIDIWAIGVIAFELNSGISPFSCSSDEQTYASIQKGKVSYPKYFTEKLIDFLKRIFVIDPKKRATASELLRHPFIEQHQVHLKKY